MSETTTHNGIEVPCFGTLEEIHAALIKELNWLGETVIINGWGYTVTLKGFKNNDTGSDYSTKVLNGALHPGTAILVSLDHENADRYEDMHPFFRIVTSGKVPHVSHRCQLCGVQLNQSEIPKRACSSCYAAAVN